MDTKETSVQARSKQIDGMSHLEKDSILVPQVLKVDDDKEVRQNMLPQTA